MLRQLIAAAALTIAAVLALGGCGDGSQPVSVQGPAADAPASGIRPTPEAPRVTPNGLTITVTLDKSTVVVGDTVTAAVVVRNAGVVPAVVGPACLEVSQGLGGVAPAGLDAPLRAFWDAAATDPIEATTAFGPRACTTAPRGGALAAGATRTDSLRWSAAVANGSTYDGGVVLRTTSTYSTGTGRAELVGFLRSDQIPLQVSGGDPRRIGPARALALALADPDFAEAVRSTRVPPSPGALKLETDPATKRLSYAVDVVQNGTRSGGSGVRISVDAATGEASPLRGWSVSA